jgi:GT2 family glycosyltransferase
MLDGAHESTACTGRFPTPWRLALLRSMLVQPGEYQAAQAYDVDWVQGSFLLIRGDLWKQLNGLDERYFMYAEDVDLCKRIRDSGYKCCYLPHFRYLHWGGFEPKRFPDQISSLATYAGVHMKGPQWLISLGTLFVGCILRAIVYYLNWRLWKRDVDLTKAMASRNALRALILRKAIRPNI